jgi:hypothetical protein
LPPFLPSLAKWRDNRACASFFFFLSGI